MRLVTGILTFVFLCSLLGVETLSPDEPPMLCGLSLSGTVGLEREIALPMVATAEVPLYPPLARAAGIQGEVRLRVSTDGHGVVTTNVDKSHPLLAQAAEKNARTWHFATHEPTTFTLTYHYRIVAGLKANPYNPIVMLRLPTEVEVCTAPMPPLD